MTVTGGANPRLVRVNLMLAPADSEWLDQLADEMRSMAGNRVASRSEVVRVAIAALRELHRLSPLAPVLFTPSQSCKRADQLALLGILAVRRGVLS
jgi:hypothetical protein